MMRPRTAGRIVGLATSVLIGSLGMLAKDAISDRAPSRSMQQASIIAPVTYVDRSQAVASIPVAIPESIAPAQPAPYVALAPDTAPSPNAAHAPNHALPDRCVAAGAFADEENARTAITAYQASGLVPTVLPARDSIQRLCIPVDDHAEEVRVLRTLVLDHDLIDAYPRKRVGEESRQVTVDQQLEEAIARSGLPDGDKAWLSWVLPRVIHAESSYDPLATSTKGARGMMQVMPGTAVLFDRQSARVSPGSHDVHTKDEYQEMLHNVAINLDLGVRVFADGVTRHGQRRDLAVAAYNAGEPLLRRVGMDYRRIPETRDYVRKVLR